MNDARVVEFCKSVKLLQRVYWMYFLGLGAFWGVAFTLGGILRLHSELLNKVLTVPVVFVLFFASVWILEIPRRRLARLACPHCGRASGASIMSYAFNAYTVCGCCGDRINC